MKSSVVKTLSFFVLLTICHMSSGDRISELEDECNSDSACKAEFSKISSDLGKVKSGVSIGKEIASVLASKKTQEGIKGFAKKLTSLASKVAPFLAVFGPAAELLGAFFPSAQSQKMQELIETVQREFKQVNNKLDTIFNSLTDMQSLIEDQHLRTQYNEDKRRIKHSVQLMENMLSASKQAIAGYKRQVKNVDGKKEVEFSAFSLKQGLTNGKFISVFMKAERSNREKVHNRLLEHYNLITQAVKFYLFWLEMKAEDVPSYNKAFRDREKARWETDLQEILATFNKIDQTYFLNDWQNNYKKDFEMLAAQGGDNAKSADNIYSFLMGKYDWRDTLLVVYNPVSGWDHHAIGRCGGYLHFRWHGKNVVIIDLDKNRAKIPAAHFRRLLSQATTGYKDHRCGRVMCHEFWVKYNDAKKTADSFNEELKKCRALIFGAIRSNSNIQIRTPSGRAATYTKDGIFMFALG